MTTQQHNAIAHIEAQHEAQRFQAEQAGREVAELDVRSVYYVVKAKIEAGLIDEAKAIVKAWKAGQL
jgi:hypothetical protein